jgi:hypothetical protein
MELLGINAGLLLIQFVFALLLIALPLITLVNLANKRLTGTPLAIWVLVICAIPLLGSVAYWIVKPTREGNA